MSVKNDLDDDSHEDRDTDRQIDLLHVTAQGSNAVRAAIEWAAMGSKEPLTVLALQAETTENPV